MLRILWELRGEPLGFRALQQGCDGMSSSVLAARLADLTSTGIVMTDEAGDYTLSETGQRLKSRDRPVALRAHRGLPAPPDAPSARASSTRVKTPTPNIVLRSAISMRASGHNAR
jgi:hypothetical protein